ncbi:MAG: hypothetical protein JNL21_32865 [Myxococcales bacterium]|nr:hypothetical protein [Myxococcales bacterium]
MLTRAGALGLVLVVGLSAGCGHPATREECSLILDKSAELKLREQEVSDPAVIEERLKSFRETRGDELLEKCVGRNITKRAISCVERADSAAAVDRCLY